MPCAYVLPSIFILDGLLMDYLRASRNVVEQVKIFSSANWWQEKKLSQMNTVLCLCAINTNIPVMSMWYKCKPKRPDRSESLTQFSQMDTHWGTSVSQWPLMAMCSYYSLIAQPPYGFQWNEGVDSSTRLFLLNTTCRWIGYGANLKGESWGKVSVWSEIHHF